MRISKSTGTSGNDADFQYGIGVLQKPASNGVTRFVVCHRFLLFRTKVPSVFRCLNLIEDRLELDRRAKCGYTKVCSVLYVTGKGDDIRLAECMVFSLYIMQPTANAKERLTGSEELFALREIYISDALKQLNPIRLLLQLPVHPLVRF